VVSTSAAAAARLDAADTDPAAAAIPAAACGSAERAAASGRPASLAEARAASADVHLPADAPPMTPDVQQRPVEEPQQDAAAAPRVSRVRGVERSAAPDASAAARLVWLAVRARFEA